MWRSSIAPDRIIATGSAMPWPAMSGALPCTASNTAYSQPMFAPGISPSPPTSPAQRSRDDVAVEVRQQQDVEVLGGPCEPRGQVVDLDLVPIDVGEGLRVLLAASRKMPSE